MSPIYTCCFLNCSRKIQISGGKLALEEKNHAALIRSGKEYFETLNKFPQDLLADSLQKLESDSPLRQETFNMALELENSAGELHFKNFMNKGGNLRIDDIMPVKSTFNETR